MALKTSSLPFHTSPNSPKDVVGSSPSSTRSLLKVVVTSPAPASRSRDRDPQSHHTMRQRPKIDYTVSSDSEYDVSHRNVDPHSTLKPGTKAKAEATFDPSDSDSSIEEIDSVAFQERSVGKYALRHTRSLQKPIKVQENGDRPRKHRVKKIQPKVRSDLQIKAQQIPQVNCQSVRDVRHEISSVTAQKRANFLVAHSAVFTPLLPGENLIQRLKSHQELRGTPSAALSPYESLTKQPRGITATMKPYQMLGLSFLVYMHKNGMSSILGDEMGLGKTLQTLSLVQFLKNETKKTASARPRPCLVVCPLSVLNSWISESKKWAPGLKVMRFHGPQSERERLKKEASGYAQSKSCKKQESVRETIVVDLESEDELTANAEDGVDLIVTTYEGFMSEESWFKRAFVWRYVILDEGHRIKNASSLISTALQGIGAEYRLLLSGTPLQNNLNELWALLHWLYPEVFTDRTQDSFKHAFDLTKGRVSTKFMDDAKRLLETIMLRRLKSSPGVDLGLPPKTDVLLYIPLTPMQRFWYIRLLTKADKGLLDSLFKNAAQKEALLDGTEQSGVMGELNSAAGDWEETHTIMRQAVQREQTESKKPEWRKLMNLLMQLRKCCNHPYILPRAEPDPYYLGDHVVHASGKFIVLEKMMDELVVKQKKKVIIFSGFTAMLDLCEDLFALRNGTDRSFNHIRLDGSTCRARRNLNIRLFNDRTSAFQVILISTRAGGLGINLATASEVIILDHDWNPQITLQAEARSHRIGQVQPVTVYKLCSQGTVEEQMLGRINKKLYLSAKVTESMRTKYEAVASSATSNKDDNEMPHLNTSELMSLVRRGAQTLAKPELDINEMIGWDWNTLLERCRDKPADSKYSEDKHETDDDFEESWLSKVEQVQSRVFDGKQQQVVTEASDVAAELSRESRRLGKNTTVNLDGHIVSKESMRCGDWEAVPTLAGKDPTLAEPKREKRAAINHQSHCQKCFGHGDTLICSRCPRSYHYQCLSKVYQSRARAKTGFICPQHQCSDCEQKTGDAGGMLYRCRWCERAFCEDCLDWEAANLDGANPKEYELLDFPAIAQAYYVKCHICVTQQRSDPKLLAACKARESDINDKFKAEFEQVEGGNALENSTAVSTRSSLSMEPMTEDSTLDNSALSTPPPATHDGLAEIGNKRKAGRGTLAGAPFGKVARASLS